MSSFELRQEQERIAAIRDQIESGALVIRHGADEALAELEQRLSGFDRSSDDSEI